MPKMEEYKASQPATLEQQEMVDSCFKVIQEVDEKDYRDSISAREIIFISDLKGRKDNQFVLMLSTKQANWLKDIWERMYDDGLLT